MRIACIGGGPAGLFFAILASSVGHEVTVHERSPEGVTYGWGVVFWDDLLHELDERDAATARAMRDSAFRWTDQVLDVQGRRPVRMPDHGYAMGRQTLLSLLGRRARELGVDLHYGSQVSGPAQVEEADLVIASDGANSTLRGARAFGTRVERGRNKYIWLGTSRVFDSFTFPFVRSPVGWVWAHAYAFNATTSTFIVEMTTETWVGLGFDRLGADDTLQAVEELFTAQLDGQRAQLPVGTGDAAPWLEFQHVTNQRWHAGNLALMGDAAHTTHFTIGSGTRLAMEDAMALADAFAEHADLETALGYYGTVRSAALRQAQVEAANSARWFENLSRYIDQDGDRFADLLLNRRSALLPYLPPKAYLRLSDAAARMPAATRTALRAVRGLRSFRRRG